MKKLNNIPLSDDEVLNKYILAYTEPDYYIPELGKCFIEAIDETNDKKLIKYIFEKYYDYNKIKEIKRFDIKKIFIKHDYNLQNLVKDECILVRLKIAQLGKYHNILHKDPEYLIRKEVARQGSYSHILYKDPEMGVRFEVAKSGHYLNVLKKDKYKKVRNAALRKLKELENDEIK